jgi:hypothetical protein
MTERSNSFALALAALLIGISGTLSPGVAAEIKNQVSFPMEKLPDAFIYHKYEWSRDARQVIDKNTNAYQALIFSLMKNKDGWTFVNSNIAPADKIWMHSYSMDIYCDPHDSGMLVIYTVARSDPEYSSIPDGFYGHLKKDTSIPDNNICFDNNKTSCGEKRQVSIAEKSLSDALYKFGFDTWAYRMRGEDDPRWFRPRKSSDDKSVIIVNSTAQCPDVF